MSKAPECSWRRWRVAPVEGPAPALTPRLTHRTTATPALSADGIRHDLVARVRAEIAAGTYDTDDRWLLAEERLLRRVEQAR